MLQSGVSRGARLQCWSPGRKYSITSRIVKIHETGGLISISVAKEVSGGTAFEDGVLKESLGEVLFSLHLPTDVLFFKGELRKGGTDTFTARVKGHIYKVQRRYALRLSVPAGTPVRVTLSSGGGFGCELLNLSEGGVALLVREKVDFDRVSKPETKIALEFKISGISVSTHGVVRHGSEAGSALVKKNYRIGLSFEGIDPKTQHQISQLVFEESSKYLGRL